MIYWGAKAMTEPNMSSQVQKDKSLKKIKEFRAEWTMHKKSTLGLTVVVTQCVGAVDVSQTNSAADYT